MDRSAIHLLHLLLLGPALLLIGFGLTDNWIPRPLLAVIGALIALYHIYKFYGKYQNGQPGWVNLVHILLVGPALMTYGITGDRWAREIILMLGFAAIGYHGYYALAPIV